MFNNEEGKSIFVQLGENLDTITGTTLLTKNDIKEIDDEDIDTATIADYLNILDRLFITDNQKPFSTKILSSSSSVKSNILFICKHSLYSSYTSTRCFFFNYFEVS